MRSVRTHFLLLGVAGLAGVPAGGPPGSLAAADEKPPALATDGVPEIPPDIFREVQPYQDIRSMSFLDWHPGGGMLVKGRLEALDQLYHVREPKAEPRQLTGGAEPVAGGRYLPDGTLIYSQGRGGDENFQIYRLAPGGGEPQLLTDGKSRNLLHAFDRSGSRISFTSTRRNGRDADVYLLEPAPGAAPRLLFQVENETWSVEEWSIDGSRALLSRFVSANESHPFILDPSSGSRVPLPWEIEGRVPAHSRAGPRAKVGRDCLRFGPGSGSVYLASDARSEFRQLVRLDPRTGKSRWLTADFPHDVEELEVSPDHRRAAFTLNAGGFSRLFILDLEAIERGGEAVGARTEVRLPPSVLSGLRFSPDSKRLGFTFSGASFPAEAHGLEIGSRTLIRWTSSPRAGFVESDFIEPETIEYPSFDGRRIPALLYRPRAAAGGTAAPVPVPVPVPVIVAIHGGPESQSRPTFSGKFQYYLRELGAAVVVPNVRGSTGYGKSYALLDNGVLREDSVRDIGALLDWISRDPRLDRDRVAVVGGSYGGFMVLASLVRFGERIRAGIDTVGISSFITFLENTSPYRRELRRAEYGDERDPEMRKFFERISPAGRMAAIRSALLVVHGANDPRVPLSEAQAIVDLARRSGRPVWTLYARNEGHGFTRRENTDYEAAVAAVFLRRHLGPSE